MRTFRTSVGKSLAILVACHTVVLAFNVVVAVRALDLVRDDSRRMYEFQFSSIAAIGKVMKEIGTLPAPLEAARVAAFLDRYHNQWEVSGGISPENVRLRKELLANGEASLVDREGKVLADLSNAVGAADSDRLMRDLGALHDINIQYGRFDNDYTASRALRVRAWMLAVGIIGALITFSLGLFVFYTVVPRARRLVECVRRFQETGEHERLENMGTDAIGMLANAIDAGFRAIVEREKERQEFVAIAAHELKTPLTSIQGYASLAVTHPDDGSLLVHALEVINRQTWRLTRLIDGLFLAIRARSKDLRFVPKPLDMSTLVERVLTEVRPFVPEKAFSSQIEHNISILGDEAMLEQGLWSLLTCASALSQRNHAVCVSLHERGWRAVLGIDIQRDGAIVQDMEELFQPFRSIEYENGDCLRLTTGLYLCREIVRVHNGSLYVRQSNQNDGQFIMELPR